MTREQVLGLVDRLKGATELSDAPVTLAPSEAVMLTRVLEELHQANRELTGAMYATAEALQRARLQVVHTQASDGTVIYNLQPRPVSSERTH